jgi:hypothetical protein
MISYLFILSEGSGKSALLATFAREFSQKNPHIFIVSHFVGSAPGSTDIRHTLQRICHEICKRFKLEVDIPDDYNELCQSFVSVIHEASFKGRILLLVDALYVYSKYLKLTFL